jgi:dihydropteroate synthase
MVTTEQPAAPVPPQWAITRGTLLLTRPLVMGIVNVTPDSFADGGQYTSHSAALAHCERLVLEGADVLDVGGESTRPGAQAPGTAAELARVLPVLQGALRLGVPVSVDTSDPVVMQQALDAGADVINDVRALTRPGALQLLATHGRAGVCLMHMRGEPSTMQALAQYGDVVAEVLQALVQRLQAVQAGGVAPERVLLDPGIGFAKTPGHNLALLQRQHELLALPRPLLLGWSRKGTLGQITGRGVGDRLVASVAAALLAVQRGASVVRVHDVAATLDALKVWRAVEIGHIDCWPTLTWAESASGPANRPPLSTPL